MQVLQQFTISELKYNLGNTMWRNVKMFLAHTLGQSTKTLHRKHFNSCRDKLTDRLPVCHWQCRQMHLDIC